MVRRKPLVVVTRKLPEVIETRMMELFDTRLNDSDTPLTKAALIEAVKAAEILVPTVTDRIDSSVLAHANPELRLIANYGTGRRPHRRRSRLCPGDHRDQHPGRADRGHRRHDHGADPGGGAAAGRRRAARPLRRLAGLEPDLDARPSHHRQAARHPRHGPDRQRGRAPGARLRARHPLPQPAPGARGARDRARGDLLGKPRSDARPHGHHQRQLPAHAGDLPSALGAAARPPAAQPRSSSTPRAAR